MAHYNSGIRRGVLLCEIPQTQTRMDIQGRMGWGQEEEEEKEEWGHIVRLLGLHAKINIFEVFKY